MLKLCRVTKVKVLFLVLVYVFNFNLFEFPAAILEKGLLFHPLRKELLEGETKARNAWSLLSRANHHGPLAQGLATRG